MHLSCKEEQDALRLALLVIHREEYEQGKNTEIIQSGMNPLSSFMQ